MSFFEEISSRELWENFLTREEDKDVPDKKTIRTIKSILDTNEYETYNINYFNNFPISTRKELRKFNTSKRRIVYVYPWRHRIVLKAVGFYILSHYNSKFSANSLAYTWGKGVKTAFRQIQSFKLKPTDVVYKNDFSDYFNAINLDILEQKLIKFFKKDRDLVDIMLTLLKEPRVKIDGSNEVRVIDTKGVMAGTPIAGILANVYMHDVDLYMRKHKYKYIRYADDTLIVGDKALHAFQEQLKSLSITFNPKKEETFTIASGITFLGFTYQGRTIRVSDEARDKMKSRMKRRAKWYRKWMIDNNVPKRAALKNYISGINKKFYSPNEDGVDWTQWYLPSINNIEALEYLDTYYVICIRYLDSGTWHRGKKFYNLQYKDIKKLGFKSLVNEYWRIQKNLNKPNEQGEHQGQLK